MEHDPIDEEHEEAYVLVEGEATVTVDEEEVAMTAGDAIRIPPDATRQIRNGDTESTLSWPERRNWDHRSMRPCVQHPPLVATADLNASIVLSLSLIRGDRRVDYFLR